MLEKEAAFAGRVLGVDHITIPVGDLEIAERFYVGVLGAEVLARTTDDLVRQRAAAGEARPERRLHTSVAFGRGPRVDLFLQQRGQPSPADDHPHLALTVEPGDLLAMKAALNARGVPTDGPRQLGPAGHASLYFNDPFGNHLELSCAGFTGEVTPGPPDSPSSTYTWTG